MEYTYEDKIKILEAYAKLSPNMCEGLGVILYSRVMDVLSGASEFDVDIEGREIVDGDNRLDILINSLDVFYGGGNNNCSLCGINEGFGAFDIEFCYPTVANGVANAACELMGCPDADFTEEGFIQNFDGREGALQSEQDELILHKGLFESILWYNDAYHMDNEPYELSDNDKLQLSAFWLEGSCVDQDYASWNGGDGRELQYGFHMRNETIDKWFSYLQKGFVEKEDADCGGKLIGTLIRSLEVNLSEWTASVTVTSFNSGDYALDTGKTMGRTFEALCFVDRSALDQGYCETEFLIAGCIPPYIMICALKVKAFLERMNAKYHFAKEYEYGK